MGTLGDYDIERPLWNSDYYTVSLAKDKRTERTVEIWWCDKPSTSPEEFHSCLAQLQLFRNHRIADVLDGDITASGGAWVACEHFDGVPLPDLMTDAGPFEPVLAIEMVLQICKGLTEAHAEGLIHGDIHPRHIVSVDDDDVRLCGLGIVQLFGLPHDTAIEAMAYRPAEVLAGGARPETDIYSVGLILYALIAGRAAFTDDAWHVLNDPPEVLQSESMPEYVWTVIERALAKKPTQRYRSMGEFLTLLHDIHGRAWDWITQTGKLEAKITLLVQARRRIQRQGRTDSESGYDWSPDVHKFRRGPEMPPMPSAARNQPPAPHRPRSRAASLRRPALRLPPLPRRIRAVEIGVLVALLWIAIVQSARPFGEPRPVSHAMTIPAIPIIPTVLPPAPPVPAPAPPMVPAPPVLAPAPLAKVPPQSPPAESDECDLNYIWCR